MVGCILQPVLRWLFVEEQFSSWVAVPKVATAQRADHHPAGGLHERHLQLLRVRLMSKCGCMRLSRQSGLTNRFLLTGLASAVCFFLALVIAVSTARAQQTTNPPASDETILMQLGARQTRVHDPSTIVKCKDTYWLFATGMGIVSRYSKDRVNWTNGPPVFTTPPTWTTNAVPGNRGHFWAPDIIFITNRYLLYYSVSTWGKNTSAIGLATNPTLDPADPNYCWTDCGPVIQSTPADNFNAIDPAVFRDTDGSLWLAFGSFWSGIKLIQLDPVTGKRVAPDSPIYSLAWKEQIEAPWIYRHGEYYYLFVNLGWCCRGTNSTYNIRVGRSSAITGPYLDKDGVDMLKGGGTLVLGSHGPFIGPGHAAICKFNGTELLSCHFYNGRRGGAPTLAILPLHWDADGWPIVKPEPRR
jgi:arabinan endo-1,5-alpha-L-arabinosidase